MKFTHIIKHRLLKNFVVCGCSGWCMECLWTGFHSILKKDRQLTCNTSIWMFPIYGMAAFLSPIGKLFKNSNFLLRGGIYTFFIFFTEFETGSFLKKHHACPWDYSKAKLNYKGLIRLDYAPLWFIVGLFYEQLTKNHSI